MEVFLSTLGFVGAACIGIVFLTLFFKLTSGRNRPLALVPAKEVLRPDVNVDVNLTDGRRIGPLRFLGFVDSKNNAKTLPYPLSQLVVFERPTGNRVVIRPDSIRFIEEVSTND